MEYDQLEPIGGLRGDWQAAAICSLLMNIAAGKSGSRKRFQPKDFLLKFGKLKDAPVGATGMDWRQMKFIAQVISVAANRGKNARA